MDPTSPRHVDLYRAAHSRQGAAVGAAQAVYRGTGNTNIYRRFHGKRSGTCRPIDN